MLHVVVAAILAGRVVVVVRDADGGAARLAVEAHALAGRPAGAAGGEEGLVGGLAAFGARGEVGLGGLGDAGAGGDRGRGEIAAADPAGGFQGRAARTPATPPSPAPSASRRKRSPKGSLRLESQGHAAEDQLAAGGEERVVLHLVAEHGGEAPLVLEVDARRQLGPDRGDQGRVSSASVKPSGTAK